MYLCSVETELHSARIEVLDMPLFRSTCCDVPKFCSLRKNFFLNYLIAFLTCIHWRNDRLCGIVVPGYTTEMYCASCEVRTEFIYMLCRRK
jgi:hypothetical protein